MQNNLPQAGDRAYGENGTVWTIREVKTQGVHGERRMTIAASGMTLGSRTITRNYYAQIELESSEGSTTWVNLTAWRNLCQYGQFEKPTYKTSRCKGYELPTYQSALLRANEQGLYGEKAREIAVKESGVSPMSLYVGPARVDGRCVEGQYRKIAG